MSTSKMINDFLDAMELIADKAASGGDVTVDMEVMDKNNNIYTLKCAGVENPYTVSSQAKYEIGDRVYVLCRGGVSGSGGKVILSKVVEPGEVEEQVLVPEYIEQGQNVLPSDLQSYTFTTNKEQEMPSTINQNAFIAYVKTHSYLQLSAKFKTDFDGEFYTQEEDFQNCNFGLKAILDFDTEGTKELVIDTNDMQGFPWDQNGTITTKKIEFFEDLSKFKGLKKLEFFVDERFLTNDSSITVSDIILTATFPVSQLTNNKIKLVLLSADNITENEDDNIKLQTVCTLLKPISQDQEFTWLISTPDGQKEIANNTTSLLEFNSQTIKQKTGEITATIIIDGVTYESNPIEIINNSDDLFKISETPDPNENNQPTLSIKSLPDGANVVWKKYDIKNSDKGIISSNSDGSISINLLNIDIKETYRAYIYNSNKDYLGYAEKEISQYIGDFPISIVWDNPLLIFNANEDGNVEQQSKHSTVHLYKGAFEISTTDFSLGYTYDYFPGSENGKMRLIVDDDKKTIKYETVENQSYDFGTGLKNANGDLEFEIVYDNQPYNTILNWTKTAAIVPGQNAISYEITSTLSEIQKNADGSFIDKNISFKAWEKEGSNSAVLSKNLLKVYVDNTLYESTTGGITSVNFDYLDPQPSQRLKAELLLQKDEDSIILKSLTVPVVTLSQEMYLYYGTNTITPELEAPTYDGTGSPLNDWSIDIPKYENSEEEKNKYIYVSHQSVQNGEIKAIGWSKPELLQEKGKALTIGQAQFLELTNGGEKMGIFETGKNPSNGSEVLAINASYIQTGALKIQDAEALNPLFEADIGNPRVLIGGWQAGDGFLFAQNVGLRSNNDKEKDSLINQGESSSIRIYCGAEEDAPDEAPFMVLNDGSVYATAAKFSGGNVTIDGDVIIGGKTIQATQEEIQDTQQSVTILENNTNNQLKDIRANYATKEDIYAALNEYGPGVVTTGPLYGSSETAKEQENFIFYPQYLGGKNEIHLGTSNSGIIVKSAGQTGITQLIFPLTIETSSTSSAIVSLFIETVKPLKVDENNLPSKLYIAYSDIIDNNNQHYIIECNQLNENRYIYDFTLPLDDYLPGVANKYNKIWIYFTDSGYSTAPENLSAVEISTIRSFMVGRVV